MERNEAQNKGLMVGCLILCVFFLAVAVWIFISGWRDISKINYLQQHGEAVQVTVTDKRVDSSRENTAEYFTFCYVYNDQPYFVTEAPDHRYAVGESFTAYIDPQNPEVLPLPNSNLFLSFLMMVLAGAILFVYEGFRAFAKFIPYGLLLLWLIMLVTGIILPYKAAVVAGTLLLVVTLIGWLLIRIKKKPGCSE